jgi:hypothetical protein
MVAGSSSNKRPFLCRFHAEGHAFKIPSSGHGVLERVDPRGAAGWRLILQFGSLEASPGSRFTAALCSPPSFMVEWRPLPPRLSAAVLPDRQAMAFFNLQASLPLRRPFYSSAACSRRRIPSGSIPGDASVDCVVVFQLGGDGAGPDCSVQIFLRFLCAKSVGCNVIFPFHVCPIVMYSTAVNESF